jgi:DNA polymerase III subunit epsilon
MQYQNFVAFDTETTGLDAETQQIIELAGVKFTVELKDGKMVPKVLGTFESFVKPSMMIPEEATRVNGITNEMVDNAPPISEVLPDFIKFCGLSTVLIAHNAEFDAKFLRKAISVHKLSPLNNPVIDNLKISRKIMPEAPSQKLGELAKRLRREMSLTLNSDNLHRALYDCEVLAHVFTTVVRKRFMPIHFAMGTFLKEMELIHGPVIDCKVKS